MIETLYGQSVASRFEVRHLSLKDGLASQYITALFSTPNGLLWLGTQNGLYYFDGSQLNCFDQSLLPSHQLPSTYVTDLEAGPEGTQSMFVCTDKGTRLVNPNRLQVINGSRWGLPDSLLNEWRQIEKNANGVFYALGQHALHKVSPTRSGSWMAQTWVELPECNNPIIVTDPRDSGSTWVLPQANEVWQVQSGNLYRYPVDENAKKAPPIPGLLGVRFTEKGLFGWDLFRNVFHFEPSKRKFELVSKGMTLNALVPGLRMVEDYLRQNNAPTCTLVTETGEQIYGTSLGAIMVHHIPPFAHLVEALRGEEIRGILADASGNWWVGTYNGLFTGNLQGEKVRKDSAIKGAWGFLRSDPDTWWLAMENAKGIGLWHRRTGLSPDSIIIDDSSFSLKDRSTLSLCRDFRGIIWAGTYRQLLCNTLETPKRFNPFRPIGSKENFIHPFIRALLSDRDSSIWIGAEDGLHHLVYSQQMQQYTVDTRPFLAKGVAVSGFYLDCFGILWIATRGKGIAKLDSKRTHLEWIDTDKGLCNNWACRIEGSEDDRVMWISTFNGLSRLDVQSGTFQNFFENSGFPGNEFNAAASARLSNGALLFGGVNGLIYFHPDSIPFSAYQYKTVVPYASVYDRRADSLIRLVIDPLEGIALAPNPEYLEMQLGSNMYVQLTPVRFRYRLRGLLEAWTYTNGEHTARFFHLLPGQYTFEAQAMPDGGHFGAVVRIPVWVQTPFYDTWWFWCLAAALLLWMAYVVYRYLLNQAMKEQVIRQQIGDDLHDDIGNKLNIISILAQKVADGLRENATSTQEESLLKLREVSRNALRSLHNMIWSVDPKKDRLSNLIARMQDFADDYLQPLHIQCTFYPPTSIPDLDLKLQVRHHVMLIYQELLTNMVKHTQPKQMSIKINLLSANGLEIQLFNGHEKDLHNPYPLTRSTYRGKNSIDRRLHQINGSIKQLEMTPERQIIVLTIPMIFKKS